MSDLEFDVLDELYFIQPFDTVRKATQLEDRELKEVLEKMQVKGWIRCFMTASDEVPSEEIDIQTKYREYLYLASKSGLLAHNTSD